MITPEFLEELKWKGVKNLEPAQVNELLSLVKRGLWANKHMEFIEDALEFCECEGCVEALKEKE